VTDGQTDRILIARLRLHCMQRGKKVKVRILVIESRAPEIFWLYLIFSMNTIHRKKFS